MTPLIATLEPISSMTALDWMWVGIASAVIFAILGPRLWRDIQGWMAPKGPEDGGPAAG